jgi:hypothetical protein
VRLAVLDGMGGHGHGRQAAEAVAAGLLRIPACTRWTNWAHLDQLHHNCKPTSAARTTTTASAAPAPRSRCWKSRPASRRCCTTPATRACTKSPQGAQPLTIDHVPATAFAMHGLLGEHEWWQQVHGEHRAQISQAYILGNAFANPQVLEDGLLPLDAPTCRRSCSTWPTAALTVRADATYLLATDGFWSCARPQPWIARWPSLLAEPAAPARSTRCSATTPQPAAAAPHRQPERHRVRAAILTKQHYPPHQSRRIFDTCTDAHKNGLQSLPNRAENRIN